MQSDVKVRVAQGWLGGVERDGAALFSGVPYAADGGRFRESVDPSGWEGVRDATAPAPVFPQMPGKLKVRAHGQKIVLEQREDAFFLNVWAPAACFEGVAGHAGLPVIFWVHGGGWASGGCSMPEYDASALVRSGRVVVVEPNYRLGALGNLCLPGACDGNLALKDLLRAFGWVHENIAAFGGDPGNITLAGQSAGAWMALAMAASGRIAGRFSKMILQSAPSSNPPAAADAERLARMLASRLEGAQGDAMTAEASATLAAAPWQDILSAQAAVGRETGSAFPFVPYADGEMLGDDLIGQAVAACGGDVVLLDGITADETAFFLARSADAIRSMPEEGLEGIVGGLCPGLDPAALLARERDIASESGEAFAGDPYELVVATTSRELFWSAGERLCAGFGRAYAYRMEFGSGVASVGACHCADLPFFFGDPAQFADFPMMEGADMARADELARRFSNAMLDFAESGDPGWPAISGGRGRIAMGGRTGEPWPIA